MGAPSAPSIVQQTTAPSADEKQAAKDAAQQKTAALMKINQDIFARSQGLRGAASMYDMAGPTPWLAGAHVGGWPQPTAAKPPAKPPGWQDYTNIGGGKGPTIPGPQSDRTNISGYNYGVGPLGDRDRGFTGYGGAPRNTDWTPPTKKLGPPSPTGKPEINPLQFQAKDPLTGQPFALQPGQHPAGGPLPPRYAAPPVTGPDVTKPTTGGPYAPPALRAAAAKGDWQTINKMTGGSVTASSPTLGAAAKPAPQPTPSRPAPAPAEIAPRPGTPPARQPSPTLGGPPPAVLPQRRTVAPFPSRSLFQPPGRH